MNDSKKNTQTGLEIAVIGMAGRFPGAANIEQFWDNLKNGVESITFYSEEELKSVGIAPDLLTNPNYVRSGGGILKDSDCFDASFFGYSPGEAEIMDPQSRIFHECAWEALEDAGYNPHTYNGMIGIYAGASNNPLWEISVLLSGKDRTIGEYHAWTLSNKEFLCLWTSYKLNLKGPAVEINTTCSTSLVAIHTACRALWTKECDIALSGGISINPFQKSGYLYQEGMLMSSDGHCRAFDAGATGTIFSSGVGIVVLKKLKEAINDRDNIYAVIKGTAINNDGVRKAGFTAPSIEGQSDAIKMAQYISRVEPESIGYIETHGTGTIIGDPIEIEALTLAFNTTKKNYCAIGSIKTNIGHLDTAAGVAGFIKTVLAIKHRQIPPSLHFQTPNPKINFRNSPFFVNWELKEWQNIDEYPLRAGVSSFGMGGTNAHAILEEYNAPSDQEFLDKKVGSFERPKAFYYLLPLSAKTQPTLDKMTENLAMYLKKNPGLNLADIAHTLSTGRDVFEYKKTVVCTNVNDAIDSLLSTDPDKVQIFYTKEKDSPVVFMFPGQGAQYENMGLGLYNEEPIFRQELDRCRELLNSQVSYDLKEIFFPSTANHRSDIIDQTEITQPAIFCFEYALAKLLMNWGIKPHAMIGHSIGEYTAACLSGVFSLEDALKLTVLRGRLMQRISPGVMLSVALSEDELKPLLNPEISLAAVNSTSLCVISGTPGIVEKFETQLKEMGHTTRRLHTSHAFHSSMMEPILEEFEQGVMKIQLNKPTIPFISSLNGQWISTEKATSTSYWARHLRETVNFRDGLSRLLEYKKAIFIEVGPGNVLSAFLRQHKDKKTDHFVINMIRHPNENIPDAFYLANKIGILWLYGVNIDWIRFYSNEKKYRISLPTYPFERRRLHFNADQILRGLKNRDWPNAPLLAKNRDEFKEPEKTLETDGPILYPRPELTKPYKAPQNEIERKLVKVFQDFLGIDQVGIKDDFNELGIDSLKRINYGVMIFNEFEVKIPLEKIFELSNINELAEYIANITKDIPLVEVDTDKPESIKLKNLVEIPKVELPKNILLTGATGFLGSHLLNELIAKTDASIYCLLRGDTSDNSCQRAKKIWSYYFNRKLDEFFDKRIFVLKGDITQQQLGLEKRFYNDLACKVDTVVHSAADVRHFGKYEIFRQINVEGTRQVIDFCFTGVKKNLHHMSTVGVVGNPNKTVDYKESDFNIGQNFEGHVYSKSKYEAEKLVYQARDNSLVASIYRIGNLVGRNRDGVFQKNIENNQLYSNLKAIILLGQVPIPVQTEAVLEMSPVDLCSEAIVKLILFNETIGSNFHITNPHYLSLKKLAEFIAGFGFPIESVDEQTFSNSINSKVKTQDFNKDVSRMFYLLRDENVSNDISGTPSVPLVTIDNRFTIQILEKVGFSWTFLDSNYISKMLQHLIDVGFLPSELIKKKG